MMLYQTLSRSYNTVLLLLRPETATGWRNVLLDGVLIAQVLMPGPASPKPRPRYKLCSFSHNYPSTVNSRAESSKPNCEPCLRPRARFRFGTGSIFLSQESCRLLVSFRGFIRPGAVITFESSFATLFNSSCFQKVLNNFL